MKIGAFFLSFFYLYFCTVLKVKLINKNKMKQFQEMAMMVLAIAVAIILANYVQTNFIDKTA
jgi:hypothetical protein